MFRLFVISSVFCAVLLIVVAILGLNIPPHPRNGFVSWHLIPALGGVLLTCLIHSMVVFYFVGTTGPIFEAAKKIEGHKSFVDQFKRLKMSAILWAGIGILAIIAVAGFGGAADMLVISYRVHAWASVVGIVVTLFVLYREVLLVAGNLQLISDINDSLALRNENDEWSIAPIPKE